MTYSSRKTFMSCGFGRVVRVAVLSVCSSSLMISLQISMHSLQTYTPGPAISFLTSFCDLPQNEQQRSSSGLRKFAIKEFANIDLRSSIESHFSAKQFCNRNPQIANRKSLLPVFNDLVDQSVFFSLYRRKDAVALDVLFNLIECLSAVIRDDP